jgi:monoamine oxidase
VHASGAAIDAAWLVVAMPMQPARRIRFTPAPPRNVADAIAGLDLGHAVKVVRQYQVPFWTAEGFSGFTVTDLPFAIAWAPTDSEPAAPGGLLTEFITGDAARDAAADHPDKRIARWSEQLDEVYPEGIPLATDGAATMAWRNEPFTGGGYAVYRPGQMARFWPALRAGFGRVRFAGEHLAPSAGYMNSAVVSGHHVAAGLGRPR